MFHDVGGMRPPARTGASAPDPIAIPVAARDDLKTYLRIESDSEDDLLDRLLAAALAHGEQYTGRLFVIRPVSETFDAGPGWRRLLCVPVRAIQPPVLLDESGVASPLPVDGYAIHIDGAGDGWVRITAAGDPARAAIVYQAGISASWGALPDPLRQGAIRLAAHLYTHRDAADDGAPPAVIAALWRPWRRMRLS